MKDVKTILKTLGLLDSEIKTYLEALRLGSATASQIAKQTGISRQGTYTAIQQLTDRGLMASVTQGKKKFFVSESPDKLLMYAKRKKDEISEQIIDLEKVIPDLKLSIGGDKPVIRFYEGKEGIKAIIDELGASNPKYLEEIGDVDAVYSKLTVEELEPYRNMIKSQKVKMKSIYSGTPQTKASPKTRLFVPDNLKGFNTNITIDDKKVVIVTFEGKMYSMIIESEAIAKTLHTLFQLAFDHPDLQPK